MRTTVHSRELAAGMERQRRKDRIRQRNLAKGKQLMLGGVNADHIYGVDDQGRHVDLKVTMEDWKVVLGFRRELVSGVDDTFVEGDPVPRTTVLSTTDIYHAVRAMKHIRQRHAKERRRNEELCRNIDELHGMLYASGNLFNDNRLGEIYDMLKAYDAEMSESTSAYKLLASRKMGIALEKLKQAMWERTAFRRRSSITQACALLTAFKSRYLWRERQTTRIDDYDRVREDGLRATRDKRLKSVLSHLAAKLEGHEGLGVACTLVSDRVMISAMRVAKAKIATGKHEDALAIIIACGKALKGEWFRGQLRGAYKFVAESRISGPIGWREEARDMLEGFARLLGQRNTRYMLTELRKTKDAYLEGDGGTLAWMEHGNAKIRQALAGDPLRRALAWVEEVKKEAAGTQLESLYRELTMQNKDVPGDTPARNELLREAGLAYEKAVIALANVPLTN